MKDRTPNALFALWRKLCKRFQELPHLTYGAKIGHQEFCRAGLHRSDAEYKTMGPQTGGGWSPPGHRLKAKRHGAQTGSRAAQPPSTAREPLTLASTVRTLTARWPGRGVLGFLVLIEPPEGSLLCPKICSPPSITHLLLVPLPRAQHRFQGTAKDRSTDAVKGRRSRSCGHAGLHRRNA